MERPGLAPDCAGRPRAAPVTDPPDITQTPMFQQAAAAAREESRRYWAPGGYADRRFPKHEIPDWWWPIGRDKPAFRNRGGLIHGLERYRHGWRVAGKLVAAVSLDPRFVAGLLHSWNLTYCRPPLPEPELRQILDRIVLREILKLEEAA